VGKRLELIWPDKEKVLLGLNDNGKPIWGTKADLETRLLVQLETVGETNPDNLNDLYEQGDNLLIKGDNLLALKALERHFAGKIKCIYIDPPFNTGNAFEYYDDGLEHTIWLSIMKARLEILKKLLVREDGVIFVHIDNAEIGYLRVLMDEILGRRNFLSQIAWERSGAAGIGQGATYAINTTEYILVYARSFEDINLDRFRVGGTIQAKTMKQYNKILINAGKRKLIHQFTAKSNGEPVQIYKHTAFEIGRISFRNFEQREDEIHSLYAQHFQTIFRTTNPQRENTFQQELISKMENGLYTVDYIPSRGKFQGQPTTLYYYNEELFCWLWETAELRGSEVVKLINMTDFWSREEIPATGIASEGGVNMKRGKKPEALVQRIIESTTELGDWVLDSFLGSGTTAAVAHKLGRKWVGVEIGEHAETLCLPRLKRVVSGEDQTGISKQVGWKGGGGFRYCVLGESLFAKDEDTGLVMINPKYTNGPLVAAVCNLEEFHLNDDSLFHGVRGNIYAHITEDKVTQAYLYALVEKLPRGKNLVVYCLKRATGLEVPEEVKVKRIPKELQIPRYLTNEDRGSRG